MIFFLLNLKHLRYFSYAGKPLEFVKDAVFSGFSLKKLEINKKMASFQ